MRARSLTQGSKFDVFISFPPSVRPPSPEGIWEILQTPQGATVQTSPTRACRVLRHHGRRNIATPDVTEHPRCEQSFNHQDGQLRCKTNQRKCISTLHCAAMEIWQAMHRMCPLRRIESLPYKYMRSILAPANSKGEVHAKTRHMDARWTHARRTPEARTERYEPTRRLHEEHAETETARSRSRESCFGRR